MTLDSIDLIEVNEAFAAQYLAVEKELGLDREKVTSTAEQSRWGIRSARPARASDYAACTSYGGERRSTA